MNIATYEMKEEDTNSQILFWNMLNSTMNQTSYPNANFYGFVRDEVRTNWCVGKDKVMLGRVQICLFH